MRRPLHKRLALPLSRRDRKAADRRQHARVGHGGFAGDHTVGDVVIDCLSGPHSHVISLYDQTGRSHKNPSVEALRKGKGRDGTECSSCLTSSTVPSLNVHLTMSVSGEAPLTVSLEESFDQKVWKSGSLMRCQTEEREAGMTADSVMEVEVGMAVDILLRDDACGGVLKGWR